MCRLHIVYGESGAAMLRLALSDLGRGQERVVAFPEVLQYAPLFSYFGETAICEYAERCAKMCIVGKDDSSQIATSILNFMQTDFAECDEVTVWRGETAGDKLFYYMCCQLIGRPMQSVDVGAVRTVLPNPSVGTISMAVCSVDNVKNLMSKCETLSMQDIQLGREQWHKWSQSQAALRLVDSNGEIVETSENVFDGKIVESCTEEWQAATRVIGKVLCKIDFAVGDSFLHRRIVELARERRIKVRQSEKIFQHKSDVSERCVKPILIGGVDVGELRLFDIRL